MAKTQTTASHQKPRCSAARRGQRRLTAVGLGAPLGVEGEALLEVEPHRVGVEALVADREVLAARQLEVAAAHADHDRTVDRRGVHDRAAEDDSTPCSRNPAGKVLKQQLRASYDPSGATREG